MPLQKRFLRPKKVINYSRIDTGIILGTIFSAIMYGFFYMFREAFRIFTSQFGGKLLLELTPKENFYYNLFYGSIAAILGFYVFVRFVFENSINHKSPGTRLRQKQVLNEQGYSMWTFLHAFGLFTVVIGIWYITMSMQFDISFIDELPLLLILIPVVLFLNIWPPILRLVGKKGYKWMAYSFVYISALSIAYGNINFVDYQNVNTYFKQHSLELSTVIDFPSTKSHKSIYNSVTVDVYLAKDSTNKYKPTIYWNDPRITVDIQEIGKKVNQEVDKTVAPERFNIIAVLIIDKQVSLSFVNNLKYELRKGGIRKILFSTGVEHSKYPKYYPSFKYSGIQQLLYPIYLSEFKSFLDSLENIDISNYAIRLPESILYRLDDIRNSNRIEIKVGKDSVLLNNSPITKDELRTFVYKFIKKYAPNYAIIYSPDNEITYNRYIEYLDLIYYSIDKLRNEMAYELYQQPFEDNFWDNKFDTIKIEYPRNIIEWTPEEKRLIKLTHKAKRVVYGSSNEDR